MALRNLHGFRTPSALRGSLDVLGAACLSLSTPPTSQTAGSSASPTGQVPLNPVASFDLMDRRRERALGTLSCVCDGVADRKAGGMVRVRWGQRPVSILTVLLFVGYGRTAVTHSYEHAHTQTNTCLPLYKDNQNKLYFSKFTKNNQSNVKGVTCSEEPVFLAKLVWRPK